MKNQNEETTRSTTPPDSAVTAETATDTETVNQLQAENAELKAAVRLGNARTHLTQTLAGAGARSPELLFESAKSDLQFADDGTLANAAAIVEHLTQTFPEQFGEDKPASSIDGGAGRVAAPALTKAALARMTPAEIAALDWAAVRQVLAAA